MQRTALVLTLAAALAGCSKSPEARPTAAALPSVRAAVTRVATTDAPILTEVTGTVRPAQRATLAAKVMGTITELPVALGQPVSAGDMLLRLSATEISARVTQARSNYNAAQRDLTRERDLLAKGASTADLVHGLTDRFAAAEAMVREAEAMLSYTELRAPFTGVVARKFVHAGDLAAPGQPLLEIEGTADFQIEADIPDSLAAHLTLGTSLLAEGPAPLRAVVAEISSRADSSARTVLVKLTVPADAALRSGQFIRVHVPAGRSATLLVPAAAVTSAGQLERVFVVEQGRAVLRLVKTGAHHHGQIEILSGLTAGETVITQPPAGLREGQPVEIQS